MHALDKLSWEILNATADDWENIDQICCLICGDDRLGRDEVCNRGEYSPRKATVAPQSQEIANRICGLVDAGMLDVRLENDQDAHDFKDRSYVWRAWFSLSSEGRKAWEASEHAALA